MRAIGVSIFQSKDPVYSGNDNSITSKYSEIYLAHPRGNIDIDPDNPPENLCKVVTRQINFNGGYEYKHIEPYTPAEHGKTGYMAGNCIAYCCDARFGELSRYPLKIHDRTE